MPRCCGQTGSTKIEAGRNIEITGIGTSQDPFVIASETMLDVEDNDVFNLNIDGSGTLESPWRLTVAYATTAGIEHFPNVSNDTPTNGYVLAWNDSTGLWEPTAPSTTEPGAVNTDTSLTGDGSVGLPLQVNEDPDRMLASTVDGLGLSDDGMNSLVRRFPDAAARGAAVPVPVLNAFSALDTQPGIVDFWDGDQWIPVLNGRNLAVQPGEFMELSGPYAGGPVWQWLKQISFTTDANGVFEVISADELADYAGVLAINVQQVGVTPFSCLVAADTTRVKGTAYRIDTGLPFVGFNLQASVNAMLY